MRLITRAEVAIEDDALTHHRDDQGYDYGDNRAVLLHVASFQINLTTAQVVRATEFDYLATFTMMRWSGAALRITHGRRPRGGGSPLEGGLRAFGRDATVP